MTKLVFGIGLNDRKYLVFVKGRRTKIYDMWHQMLNRSYSKKCQDKHPSYRNCDVSDNFKNYSYFHEWAVNQIGFGLEDWHLDKDIICKGNKLYSENTCAFVPLSVNNFFTNHRAARGQYPTGVSFRKKGGFFVAQCMVEGRVRGLGLFKTPEEAYQTYKKFKEQLCKDLANKWRGQIDPRVYSAMMVWVVDY